MLYPLSYEAFSQSLRTEWSPAPTGMRLVGGASYTRGRGDASGVSDSGEGGVAISARLRRTPAQWILYACGGLALSVSAAFGGLQTVSHERPALQVGQVDVGKPWNVKVVAARLLQDLEPAVYLKNKEDHWLVIIAEVEITDTYSHTDINRIIRVPQAVGILVDSPSGTSFDEYPHEVLLSRDGTRAAALHPGMTERVAYLWEQKPDALPTSVAVDIMGLTWRKSSLSGEYVWFDEAVRASLTVPVEDKRDG